MVEDRDVTSVSGGRALGPSPRPSSRLGLRPLVTSVMAGVYALKLATTTLTPGHALVGGSANNLVPLRTIGDLLTDAVSWTVAARQLAGNLVLLMPLAILLFVVGLSWRRTMIALAVTSVAIELLQAVVVPNRTGDVDDVLLNVLGSALVLAISYPVRTMVGRRSPRPT
jgi:glycopeptide antibiotics resistance protein